MKKYIMGVDLGRLADYTAVAIIEETFMRIPRPTVDDLLIGHEGNVDFQRIWHLRHLSRFDLRTPYAEITQTIAAMCMTPELKGQVEVVPDKSGVGTGVVELFYLAKIPVTAPVTITFGAPGAPPSPDNEGGFHVPKVEVVSSLQAMIGTGCMKIASGLELVPHLLREMEAFKLKQTQAKNLTFEAWREGDHDDIVLAVSIAAWWASFSRPKVTTRNVMDTQEEPITPKRYLDNARKRNR